MFQTFLEGGTKILTGWNTETKCGVETEGKAIQSLPHLGDPSHIQTPNPDNIVDANKCMTGAWYSCLLRGSDRAWQIQRQMLAAKHWTENRVPIGEIRERTEGAKRVCNPKRTTISTNQNPQSFEQVHFPHILITFLFTSAGWWARGEVELLLKVGCKKVMPTGYVSVMCVCVWCICHRTIFFFYWVFYLHFKCYPYFRFSLQKPDIPSPSPCFYEVSTLTHPPIPFHLSALTFPYTGA